jgi:glycosyltransferase involved in cell wall biosynthesis
MKISYIITTFNRYKTLVKHLDNDAFKFYNRPDELEIIIADDGTKYSDEELEKIKSMSDIFVTTVNYDKATPSKARNLGIEAATGDLLIFADDDCIPHFRIIREYLKTKEGYCSVGYRSSQFESLLKDVDNFDPNKDLEPGRPQLYWQRVKDNNFIWHHFSSGSFAIWREDLGAVRFDEDFVGYGLEDRHFAWLLAGAGIKFEFLYTAIIYHDHAAPNRPRSQKDEELQINKKMFYGKIKE